MGAEEERNEEMISREEYYNERFAYEAECEVYDEEEEPDEYEWNGYSSEEDYWRERI